MHGDEPVRLGDSLHEVVRSLRPHSSSDATTTVLASALGGVFGRWEEAVGDALAAHVQPVKLDGTTLVVVVDDPAWATQLKFLEATLKQRLAEIAGATIDRIEVRVGR
jgi:predicted nucleic acid-binding Zn ribbon protein